MGEWEEGSSRGLHIERAQVKPTVGSDRAAGTAGMRLVERPEPSAAINDVIVEVHASGFVPTEIEWPSTWIDRADRPNTVDPRARAGGSGHRTRLRFSRRPGRECGR